MNLLLSIVCWVGAGCFVLIAGWLLWVLCCDWRRSHEERVRWAFDPVRALKRPLQINVNVVHSTSTVPPYAPRR